MSNKLPQAESVGGVKKHKTIKRSHESRQTNNGSANTLKLNAHYRCWIKIYKINNSIYDFICDFDCYYSTQHGRSKPNKKNTSIQLKNQANQTYIMHQYRFN